MKKWFASIGRGLGSLLAGTDSASSLDSRKHRERVVELGLRRLAGSPPTKEAKQTILQTQARIDAIHRQIKEQTGTGTDNDLASSIQFDGLSRLTPVQTAAQGYLLVYVQGFLTGILQQLAQKPKPIVSVVFRLHEDPTAHVPVLERGHGLAFELPFFPEEGPAQLTDFLGELTAISQKGAAFAIDTGVPVLPVWCRVDSEGLTLEIAPPLAGHRTTESLTCALASHFARRIQASPAEMDWEADCWYPPAHRLLPSRFPWALSLSSEHALKDLQPFRVLVRVPDQIREACLAVPAIRALKRGRADVELTILTSNALFAFWQDLPDVDAVLPLQGEASASETNFALGIIMSRDKSALADLKPYQIERTVGMENHPASNQFDDVLSMPRKLGPPEHRHRSYLRLAHRLGAEVLLDKTLTAPVRLLDAHPSSQSLILGIAPQSQEGSSYAWEAARYQEVARQLTVAHKHLRVHVLLTGDAPEDWQALESELGQDKLRLVPVIDALDSRLTALQSCQIVLANDNAWLHLASTVYGLPTIAIYGPSEPIETAPLSKQALTLRRHVECTPCFLAECPIDHRCLKEIDVDHVIAAVNALL